MSTPSNPETSHATGGEHGACTSERTGTASSKPRRITDHNGDTPLTRPSSLAADLRERLTTFGDARSMLTGEAEMVECMHCLPRSMQEKQPGKFLALKMSVGKRVVLKNGRGGRHLNLDTHSNMDAQVDPTSHRRWDGKSGYPGDWSILPLDYVRIANEIAKKDGRSYDEICPGEVFAYNILTYDGQTFSKLIYDEPFRALTPLPPSLASEASECIPVQPTSPTTAEAEANVAGPSPLLNDEGMPSAASPRKQRVLDFPCAEYIVYSIINPVFAITEIMTKLTTRLSGVKTWPPQQRKLYDFLEPRTRHLLEDPFLGVLSGDFSDGDLRRGAQNGSHARARRTMTAPADLDKAQSNVRITRGRAKALTEAAAVNARVTRSKAASMQARAPAQAAPPVRGSAQSKAAVRKIPPSIKRGTIRVSRAATSSKSAKRAIEPIPEAEASTSDGSKAVAQSKAKLVQAGREY